MSDPYLGEIRLFAGLIPPKNWLPCDGRTLKPGDFSALFSLLGVKFGGDGINTFALPDLRGRTPIGYDPAQSATLVGTQDGAETVSLSWAQMPVHKHTLRASDQPGVTGGVANAIFAKVANNAATPAPNVYASAQSKLVSMDPNSVTPAGGSAPHSNMQASLAMTFMICTVGLYPHRP